MFKPGPEIQYYLETILWFQNNIVFLSLIVFVLANSEDPDEIPHSRT